MPHPVRSTLMLRLPRWAALFAVPLLAGAVLVMHGASADTAHAGAPAHEAHSAAAHHDDDADCTSCVVSHLLVACVAVIAMGTAVSAARRHLSGRLRVGRTVVAPSLRRVRDVLLRPPEPAWVRLTVMRC